MTKSIDNLKKDKLLCNFNLHGFNFVFSWQYLGGYTFEIEHCWYKDQRCSEKISMEVVVDETNYKFKLCQTTEQLVTSFYRTFVLQNLPAKSSLNFEDSHTKSFSETVIRTLSEKMFGTYEEPSAPFDEISMLKENANPWVENCYEVNLNKHFRNRIPASLGGMPLEEVKFEEYSKNFCFRWTAIYGEKDSINLVMKFPLRLRFDFNDEDLKMRVYDIVDQEVLRIRKDYPGDFEVICIENTGMEDFFNLGVSYLGEPHQDKNFYWVYDKLGVKRECSTFRFRRGK
jgi:hypothetical protein